MTSFALYLLESAACLALFYMGFRLFLRKETYFKLNRVYLVCSLFFSLILPVFKITSPIFTVQTFAPMSFTPSALVPIKTWSFGETLLLVYAIGVGLFLTRFIFHMIRLNLIVKKYRTTRINGIKIVSVDRDFSPFSFLNFIFINDKILSEHNMRRIIAHEIIHIKQYHTFDILLIELITVLQWFNPFVWPYKKSLQETHEFLADYGVLAQGFSTAKYQLLMFEQHVGVKLFEFANNFKQSQIKRRITMMSKIKSRGTSKLKLLLIVPMAAFLLLAFAEPKAADIKVADKATLSANQNAGQKKEEMKKKQMEKVKVQLENLKKEEMILREKMDATEDPNKKAEIKAHLKEVLTKEKVWIEVLASGVLPLPPKAKNPPSSPKAPLPPDAPNASTPPPPPPKNEKKLKQEYKILSEKEEVLRAKMETVTDANEKTELKTALVEVLNKQKKIESWLGEPDGSNGVNLKLDDLKKQYTMLEEKAEDLRKQIENTDDPDIKTKCKQMLSDIQKKQQLIKEQAEATKTGKEVKKIK